MGKGVVMQRIKTEKKRRETSKGKKIFACIICGVIALSIVFCFFAFRHERLNYVEARDITAEIIRTKSSIEKIFDTAPSSLDLSDDEQKVMQDFETVVDKYKNYVTSLKASNIQKDEKVVEKFSKVEAEYGKIEKLAAIWGDVKLVKDLSDENLEKLKSSQSEYLQQLAKDLSGYRAEIAEFKNKYGEGTKGSTELMAEYSKIELKGDEIAKKYSDVQLGSILGMSRDDISGFYATIEELDKYLSEKL